MYRYYGAPAVATSEVETNKIICEVCNIRCSCIGTLRRHEAGKKHRMNLDLQAENCMMSNVGKNMPEVVQSGGTLDCPRHHEVKNCTISNVDKNIPEVVQTVTCEVCQIQCGTTLDDLRRHETSRNHKRILWKLQEENRLMSNLVKKTPAQPATCEVCERQFINLKCLRVHEEGKNHKRILRKLQAKNVQPATCEVCKIQLNTLDCLRIHETGKKHKKNLEKLQDSITPIQENPLNGAVGASTTPAAADVADGVIPAVQPKKIPKVVQLVTCEVCKVQCNSLNSLRAHETGTKHKKNLEKLQRSITPEPAKPPNDAVGASTEPAVAVVADGVMPAVQPKKNKRPAASLEDLEVKRRRVLEPGSAEGEVKNCTVSNAVKKIPEDVHPVTCELCKMQCLIGLRAHKKGKKHKKNLRNLKNLEKFQDSITPKQENPPNGAVGASTTPAAADVANGVIPAVQPKKKKRCASTLEDLEVKRRRVIEHGSAEGEVDKANLQQQQQQQVQQLPIVA